VKLKVHDSIFVPLAKWPMLMAGNYRCIRRDDMIPIKEAVHAMHSAALEALGRCQLSISDIDCIIPHQANQRIIDAVTGRLGARPEQVFTNLRKYGNTSGAAVAIALAEAVESGRVQRGDLVLLLAFGAGLTWAAAIIEW